MTVTELPIEIAKLELKPGDILTVSVPIGAPRAQLDYLVGHIKEVLPEGVRAIITSKDLSFSKTSE